MIRAMCVDSSGRPESVPTSKWVVEGQTYNITYIYYHPLQRCQGVELAEIDLIGCAPFGAFKLERFAFDPKDIPAFIELCKNCTLMADEDITSLIEELQKEKV